jgi:hypothetical protein
MAPRTSEPLSIDDSSFRIGGAPDVWDMAAVELL